MATGNNKVTTPIKEVNGKLVIGQGIDAFQVAVTKDGKLAVEDPTTRIAGHYPDMYPWNAPEGYPDMAISFAKDGSYPPDNIPVSCLPGAIRALKQLVLHTSTGVDTPPVDDPQTSLASDVEDGDLVVIAADGLWHKATVPTLEEPTPPVIGGGEGAETSPMESTLLSGIWREFSPETYKLATMMLFSGVYIERLGQVVTNNYVTHSDWSFDSGAVLYLDTDRPGKLTTEDTGYPVGSAQLSTDYGTTVYLDPFLWGIERGVAEALRLSGLAVGNMEDASKALQERIDDVSEKQALYKEAQDLVNTELRDNVASLDIHQQELNQAVATIQGRQDTLEEQHEALEETQTKLDQKLETKFTEVTTKIEEQKTVIETVTSGSRGFWYPEEPIGFSPIDTSRFLVLGDIRDKVLVDMALKVLPSNTPDVYVRDVTYDSLTGFTTVAVTSPYAEGDKSFYYGLPKEVMPKIEAEGGSGPVDPSDIPNIPVDKLPPITGDMLPEVPIEKLPEIPVEKLPEVVVTSPDDLPNASADVRGLVKLDGVTTTIDENGNLKAVYTAVGGAEEYVLPVASAETLGGVKVGENILVSEDGILSNPLASVDTPGVVQMCSSIAEGAEGVATAAQIADYVKQAGGGNGSGGTGGYRLLTELLLAKEFATKNTGAHTQTLSFTDLLPGPLFVEAIPGKGYRYDNTGYQHVDNILYRLGLKFVFPSASSKILQRRLRTGGEYTYGYADIASTSSPANYWKSQMGDCVFIMCPDTSVVCTICEYVLQAAASSDFENSGILRFYQLG